MILENIIAPLATPTRFLIESGEWNLTPNLGDSMQQEMNPFDCNFQQQQQQLRAAPTVKALSTNELNNWTPTSPTVFTKTAMYQSPEPEFIHTDSITPPTPPMSLSQSPSSSSSTFSLSSDHIQTPKASQQVPQHIMTEEEYNTRRSSRIQQTKQNSFFSDYLEEETEYKPKTASVQSGRKRRIVFEGDDAEDRRKKFLERNRVAAYKCRQKKKNWMQELEQKADIQNTHNDELRNLVAQLKEESMYLRNLLLTHGNCDCDSVQAYLRKTSAEITAAPSLSRNSSISAFPPMPSYPSSMPSFTDTSTGLTPFLNTVINKPENQEQDYFSQQHGA